MTLFPNLHNQPLQLLTLDTTMSQPHFLVVAFPAQGHINPSLQFSTKLTQIGARVTFATCLSAFSTTGAASLPNDDDLVFASFSDGYDGGFSSSKDDPQKYMSEFKRRGTETLTQLIEANKTGDRPFTCLVYTLLLPWASEVARDNLLPSVLLWIQPATVFDLYYYYFNGYEEIINSDNPSSDPIEFPGLSLPMCIQDLPSFLIPSNTYAFALPAFREQIEILKDERYPKVLVNTFDALEPEALAAIPNIEMVAVGPLISPGILNRKSENQDPEKNDYIRWLDSQVESSVIYISFGTIAVLSKEQLVELAQGILDCGRPFLWVITEKPKRGEEKEDREMDNITSFKDELEKTGMIVSWCSQVEVLKHPSIGCFLTHGGWNSTLESLVCGVPVVAFPQWTDQTTNAKLLEDSWKTGVRVRMNEKGVVESGEIRRCLEVVMEERAQELRGNAKRWSQLATDAAQEGGASDKNLKAFVDSLATGSR